jgi:hypothetical protein
MDNVKNLTSIVNDKVELLTINPLQHSFEKIFPGDGGDGVPGVYSWITETKDGKKRENTLTSKRMENVWTYMSKKYSGKDIIYKLPNELDFIYDSVNSVSKGRLKEEMDMVKFKKQIERNIKLMYLDSGVIPMDIQNAFLAEYDENINITGELMNKFNINNFYIDKLIPGTKFDNRGIEHKVGYFKDEVKFDKGDFFFDENDKLSL